jgi:DNA repair exonuclease SbcCD ATPase subunit
MIRKKEWETNTKMWKECQEKSRMLQCLMNCIDRDGLPLYLLRMYLPIIEDDINMLIHTFLDNKKLVLRVQEDSVVIGLQGATTTSQLDSASASASATAPSNYMGGMESFIVDLSVKMGFAKYSRLPQSNFFIIDEGISVFDQERVANIYVLFNFLTSISEHVFLISHLPTIKDFVSQSIEVDKDQDQKSHLTCCF